MRAAEAAWFPGFIPQEFPDRTENRTALLLKIDGGTHHGCYVALTSRVELGLSEQFAEYGCASTVVHLIKNPTGSYVGNQDELYPVAMAVIESFSD